MRVLIFFSLFLSALSYSFAQNSNDLDKQYTPDKSSIFNNEGSSSSQGKNKNTNDVDISNAIKFNFGLLVRNTAGLYWERKVSDRFTIQPGIGLCYGKDKLMQEIGGSMDMTPQNQRTNTVPFGSLLSQGNLTGVNIFTSLACRIYFGNYYYGGETFQGGYLEINVRYSSMNVDIPTTGSSATNGYAGGAPYYIPGLPTVNFRTVSYYLTYGYQLCTTGKIKTTHDFYFGFGFRSVKYDSYILENTSNQYTGTADYTYISSGTRATALIPSLVAGYVLGFGF